LSGDVRVCATIGIVQAGEGTVERGDVLGHDGILVGGAGEVGGEAAAGGEGVDGVEGDDLGGVVHGGPDGGDVWAAGGEFGEEGGCVFAVIGEAAAGDLLVSTRTGGGGEEIVWMGRNVKFKNGSGMKDMLRGRLILSSKV
jgi:hypothetical protein